MKERIINAVLNKKFNDFLESIDDKEVRDLVSNHSIITGGCIPSMLLNEPVNDFDIYFTNINTVEKVAEYYATLFEELNPDKVCADVVREDDRIKMHVQSQGVATEEDIHDLHDDNYDDIIEQLEIDPNGRRYRPVFISPNAISLSNKVQLILRFYGNPDEIHRNYDFVHCTSYWDSASRHVTLRPEAVLAVLNRELLYVGSRYPVASVIRTRKFIKRGWSITAGQYLKMAMQISQLDLTNLEVLEDQLVGVDVTYFIEVLALLKERADSKVDYAYLSEIIDRMF